MMQLRNNKIALIGLLIACGILFGYVEVLFPLPIGIPGVKLGLSNIVTLMCLYLIGPLEAFLVLILRVFISGILFGNVFGLLYGLTGAFFSYIFMLLLKYTKRFSVIGVSALGGVIHNIAQLLVAVLIISEIKLTIYLPVLIISGLVCGILVGFVAQILIIRLKGFINKQRDI